MTLAQGLMFIVVGVVAMLKIPVGFHPYQPRKTEIATAFALVIIGALFIVTGVIRVITAL